MMTLVEYLHQTKTVLNNGFRDVDCVHVVIGNESCDLDSAVCAITWAYCLNLSFSTTTVAVIPLLNIPQQKYHLRTETTFLFRNHGISDDLLTFCDDLDLHDLQRQQKLKLSLVDHNVLPEKYSELDNCVISVTDHRPQVRKPDCRVKINIAPVGSCSTLVAEDILSQTDFEVDNTILKLLYGAILIDTINLNPVAEKMTERDVAMVDRLEELMPDVNRDDLYNNIKKAKTDITELTTGELLEKDLKIVSGNKVKIAMASVSMELQNLMSRDNLMEDFHKFAKSQSVSAVVVMMLYEKLPGGQPFRDIALYSTQKVLQEKICNCLIKEKDPDLILTLVPTVIQNVIAYHQGCIKASRKVVLPIIQKAVYEHENGILLTDQSNTAPLDATKPLDGLNLLNNQSPASSAVTLDNSQNNSGTDKNINTSNNDLLSDIQPNTGSKSDILSSSSAVNNTANILLGDLDFFATPVNNLQSNIPEISINNSSQDVFDEVDIMFEAFNSRTSQCSSANTSEPGSALTSYPITPPNSFIDTSGHLDMKNFTLPSLNSAEMLEKIQEKKGRLRSSESTSVDNSGGNSVPYTPQNSFMEGVFEQYAKDHQLPSFNSIEMVQRIRQKRSSMEMSRLDENEKLRSDSIEVTPYTPHNSYRDISLLDNNAWAFLDTNKLQQSLEKIEHVAKHSALHENLQKINDHRVLERTDSGLVIYDTSDLFNPTTIDNNIVAVGLAQEMIQWETTADNLLLSFDEGPSDGGNKKTDSSSLEKKSSKDEKQSNSSSDLKKFDVKGGKSDFKTEALLLHQSIDEFAKNLTGKLIDEAIIAFPEIDEEIEGSEIFENNHLQQRDERNVLAPTFTEPIVRSSPEDLPLETDYLSSVDPLHGNLNLIEDNQEIVRSSPEDLPLETDYLSSVDPLHGNLNLTEDNQEIVRSSPEDLPLETDYLSSVDPLHGNLNLTEDNQEIVRSSPEDLPLETDYLSSVDPLHGNLNLTEDNQEIAESISFRKVSGEEPQTVRQEILQHYVQEKVDEESSEGVGGYAAKLVQHVITGAIATVTSTFNTTDITEESGGTWSREESVDTVSSLPLVSSLDQTSAERSNLDQTFDSDEKQTVSKEMQETLDYHSFSSKQFNEPVAGTSETSFENSNGAMNNDYIKDKVSVLKLSDPQSELLSVVKPSDPQSELLSVVKPSDPESELLSVVSDSSSMEEETAENEMSKSGKIDSVSAKYETNISKPSVGSLNLHKIESVDYISSEDETDKLSPLKLEQSGLLHQSMCVDKESVPCNFGKKESVEFISSEGESDNSVQSQAAEKPTYHKADTVDYISSEGEGPGIYCSQSSESTSTTTEGSYQVISPDQQLIDIKGEVTELIKTEIGAIVTNMVSEIKQVITDVCQSSDLEKSFSDNHFEKIISNDSLNSGNSVISENESEKLVLRSSNSEVKIVNSPELRMAKQDDNLDDKVTNSEQEKDSSKKKEIYMTSVGRISIASDGEYTASSRQLTSDRFMEESCKEVGKLIAVNTLAQADEIVTEAETILACLNTALEPCTKMTGDGLSNQNEFDERQNLKTNEITTKREDPVNLEKGDNQSEDPVNLEKGDNQSEDPVNLEKGDNQSEDPVNLEKRDNQSENPVNFEKGDNQSEDPVNLEKGDNQSNINSDITQVKIGTDNKTVNLQKKCTEGTEKLKGADSVKRGMDLTEEWHEDPIPGMEHNDTDSSDSRYSSDSDSDNSDRPANMPSSLQTRKKKKISANFNILKEDYTSPDDIDTTDNAGDLEWENDTPVSIPSQPIPEYSADDEYQDAKHWRGVEINGKQQRIDLKVIDPYKKVLSHGGYYGDGLNAIIVFSGCFLPDRNRKDYQYVMNNLFLYVISTLELLVAEDYMIVYFHGATPRRQMPSFGWLKKCYQMIDRRLKKNLKGLLLIHPTLWLRTIVLMTKPFISSKFSSKLRFVRTLHDLSNIVPLEHIYVPDQVQKYDRNLLQPPHSPLPPPLHHTHPADNTNTTDMSKCRRNLSRPETKTSTETEKEDG